MRWLVIGVVVVVPISWYILIRDGDSTISPSNSPDSRDEVISSVEQHLPGSVAKSPETTAIGSSTRQPASISFNVAQMASVASPKTRELLDHDQQLIDPRQDGWKSEAVNDDTAAQLKQLGKMLLNAKLRDARHLSALVTEDFTCAPLRPAALEIAFRDAALVIRRSKKDERPTTTIVRPGPADKSARPKDELAVSRQTLVSEELGIQALSSAIANLSEPLAGAAEHYVKFKITHVKLEKEKAHTTAYLEAKSVRRDGSFAMHATWHCDWIKNDDGPLRLTSIRVADYEEVEAKTPHGTWFTDCTESVLKNNASWAEQLVHGVDYWANRIDKTHQMELFSWYGLAVGDINSDGLDDVYVCQSGGLPNRLFIQNPDGTATDRSAKAGVNWLDLSRSALIVDLNNDGHQDLIVALPADILVMRNDGRGRFDIATEMRPRHPDIQSLTAVDYDGDGDLDLYVCIARQTSLFSNSATRNFVFHDANDGGANRLYRNDIELGGDWRFVDVTKDVGLDVHNRRHSLAAAWEDFDNDGDSDLYVANDYGLNCLYRNDVSTGGGFTEIAAEANITDRGSGMSVSWGDYNRDGYIDLYVANMFSSAGHRITGQSQFLAHVDQGVRKAYRRFAKGNTLFQGQGDGTFREMPDAAVELGRWAWSSLFVDLNNDTWQDLVVANGFISAPDTQDL